MDLFDAEWLLRVLSAVAVGFLIGMERHRQSKSAGIRTHMIVAMASCLVMIVSEYAFPGAARNDPARIAAGVVSGIGFLGAGIIFTHNGSTHGLTTAAGVWAMSAVGLTFGAGMYKLGFFCGLLMFVIESFLQKTFSHTLPYSNMVIVVKMDSEGSPGILNEELLKMGYNHSENRISAADDGWIIETTVRTNKELKPKKFIEDLSKTEHIVEVRVK